MENEGRNRDGAGIHLLRRNAEVGNMPIEEHAVNWEGPGSPCPRLRLLLLSDVDLASAGRVVEWTIEEDIAFDLCIVCGDFISRSGGFAAADDEQEEKLSTEEGEMSAILAQLENTVCRVVYIPGPLDPLIPSVRAARRKASATSRAKRAEESGSGGGIGNTEGRARRRGLGGALGLADPERWVGKAVGVESEDCVDDGRYLDDNARVSQLQLTPTSKNLFRRTLRLAPGLSAAGFTQELRMENVPCPVVTGTPDDELAPPPVTPSSFNVGERRAGKGGIAWNLDLSGDEGGDNGDLSGYYSPELSGKDASTEFFMSDTGTLFAVEETKEGSGGVAWQLEVVGDGDASDTPDNGENIIPFLRTLCRPRTHAARASAVHASVSAVDATAREEKGINAALKRSPVWTLSNSNPATSSSSYAEIDPDTAAAGSSSRVAVQDDSMILLTRTGGPLSCNNDPDFVYYGGVGESGDVNNITGIRGQEAKLEKEMEFAMVRAQENLEAMAAARLLRRLWAQEASRKRRRSVSAAADVVADRDGGTERGGLLLHVCAGPGAARAVREMLASGQANKVDSLSAEEASTSPSRPGGQVNGSVNMLEDVKAKLGLEECMPAKGGGLGCRIGDFTVVALGSLREEGAHCVVELGFPENLEGVSVRGKGDMDVRGWSVASVRFGRVGIPSVGERAALAHEYSSRGGDQGFIVNFD